MKKIGLLTINDNYNNGNRLQNYALQEFITNNYNVKVETIWNNKDKNTLDLLLQTLKNVIKIFIFPKRALRYIHFKNFNKNINHSKYIISNKKINVKLSNYYNYFITGSDQVWNPNFKRLSDIDLLSFVNPNKRISYAASFGINELPEKYKKKTQKELLKFKAISLREKSGKKIVEELTGRKDVQVLVDPTMLLTSEEWDKVSKRPKQLDNIKEDKYILNYFLGTLSEERQKEIERIATENNCHIINILDKKNPFYAVGPSEFLYLEKHAFLICTDSFHSSVFAILYNTPFVVFDREDNIENMSSRIDTLLSKFKLEDRKYNGKISKELLKVKFNETIKILEKERLKSKIFLNNNLK